MAYRKREAGSPGSTERVMEASSVEDVCNLVIRSRLLSAGQVHTLFERWCAGTPAAATDGATFLSWLAKQKHLTEYQADWLRRGRVDYFFLGEYKILERLARGSMAGVYKAVHELGQVVAIKILPPPRAQEPTVLARFRREARLAVRLKHPNVARTFHVGQADSLHYIVMEYLEGETLEEVLQRRASLPPAEAARLLYQALLGLQHLHEQGLVHRDLKPANLMLVPARAEGTPDVTLNATVKIMDIGLGRALFDEGTPGGADNFQLTNEGAILGTPDYLAPEQARDARQADVRADIYSLGCVLYHALTGQPPFVESNLVRQLLRHATETPRPLRDVDPAIPEGLQPILDRMLAKDPASRYPTPDRAAQALQTFLGAGTRQPPAPDPASAAYLTWLDDQPLPPEVAVAPPPAGTRTPEPVPPTVGRTLDAYSPAPVAARQAERPTAPAPTSPPPPGAPPLVPARNNRPPVPKRPKPAGAVEAKPDAIRGGLIGHVGRRDFLMMALGAGVLLVLELVSFVFGLLLVHRKEDTPDNPSGAAEETHSD